VTGQFPLSPDASMSVKRVETGAGGDQVVAGGWGGLGDRPASPSPPLFWLLAKLAELWPTEACLPVRARGGNLRKEISDEGAPSKNSSPQAPTKEELDGPERTRTIRQDSSKNRRTLYSPSEARSVQ
jgi:hypothetical protein